MGRPKLHRRRQQLRLLLRRLDPPRSPPGRVVDSFTVIGDSAHPPTALPTPPARIEKGVSGLSEFSNRRLPPEGVRGSTRSPTRLTFHAENDRPYRIAFSDHFLADQVADVLFGRHNSYRGTKRSPAMVSRTYLLRCVRSFLCSTGRKSSDRLAVHVRRHVHGPAARVSDTWRQRSHRCTREFHESCHLCLWDSR